MDNKSNLVKYKRLAPIYNWFFTGLNGSRKKAWSLLKDTGQCEMLLVGVGTGIDFDFMPEQANVTAIDLSKEMLAQAGKSVKRHSITLMEMNAEVLHFDDAQFDVVVLNLILSVAQDPQKVMSESLRVLKPQGKILIWDKFSKTKNISWAKKIINYFTSWVGTDITRNLEMILSDLSVTVLKNESNFLGGMYRAVLLTKN